MDWDSGRKRGRMVTCGEKQQPNASASADSSAVAAAAAAAVVVVVSQSSSCHGYANVANLSSRAKGYSGITEAHTLASTDAIVEKQRANGVHHKLQRLQRLLSFSDTLHSKHVFSRTLALRR